MTHGQNAADNGAETYAVNIHAKAQSSTSCSFCWFVLSIYPTLKDMTPRDRATFTEHLKTAHGLKQEIMQ